MTTADALYAEYKHTVAMLADAARRYQQAQREAVEAQQMVMALSIERERLLGAVEAAVADEVGGLAVVAVDINDDPQMAVGAPVGHGVEMADFGG